MLPYKNRLIKRTDFEKVYKYGRLFYFENVAVKIIKNGIDESRIGFSVGIKFSKKAVERNRAKRQLREILRKMLAKIEKGADVVVMIKKAEKGKNEPKKLAMFVEKALEKGNLINNVKN
jgi:ribonuclease P protein component